MMMNRIVLFLLVLIYFLPARSQDVNYDRWRKNNQIRCDYLDLLKGWGGRTITGVDYSGNKVEFIIRILTQENRWVINETTQLETGPVSKVLKPYLSELSLLEVCHHIICVGMASEEGDFSQECGRADKRADAIIREVRPLLRPEQQVYKLNLGKYKLKTGQVDTSYQRRVVVVGVIEKNMHKDSIRQALYNALRNDLEFKSQIEFNNYNDFKFQPV
jgi:hypothetical protein